MTILRGEEWCKQNAEDGGSAVEKHIRQAVQKFLWQDAKKVQA
jgi:hypothetical protein